MTEGMEKKEDAEGQPEPVGVEYSHSCFLFHFLTLSPPPPPIIPISPACAFVFFALKSLCEYTKCGRCPVRNSGNSADLMFNSLLESQRGQQEICFVSSHEHESEMKYVCGRERLKERQRETNKQRNGTKLCERNKTVFGHYGRRVLCAYLWRDTNIYNSISDHCYSILIDDLYRLVTHSPSCAS